MEMRYVIASYPTPEAAEAARAALASAGLRADVLPPSRRWADRLASALGARPAGLRLGVAPEDVDRAVAHLGLARCGERPG
jgi:hypothetical protein